MIAGTHHFLLQAAICLAVGAAVPVFRQSTSPVLNRVAHLVARYSYGVYLFHVVALWIGYFALSIASPLLQALGSLIALVALSVMGYHLIEKPGIRVGVRLSRALTDGSTIRKLRVS
jgi:peptidoglycan/LPS O-acetylase OafA/YrhL